MTELPPYPGRHVADSIRTEACRHLAQCPECGRRSYAPYWVVDGRRTYCDGCDAMTAKEQLFELDSVANARQ